jgi:Xaa-Pro aminopeptidase
MTSLSRVASRIGQPMHWSHPGAFSSATLTPHLPLSEFAARRSRAASLLPAKSVLLVTSRPQLFSSHDIPVPYRTDADLVYLTGFEEPVAACLIDAATGEFHMAVQPRSPEQELWHGMRAGVDVAREAFGADSCVSSEAEPPAASPFARRLREAETVLVDPAVNPGLLRTLLAGHRPRAVASPRGVLDALRVRKSEREVGLVRRACEITAEAFERNRASCESGEARHERVLAAQFEFEARKRMATRLTFPCVVAGGPNALCLHYLFADAELRVGDLVLQDSGAEFQYYCADVTRTWAVDGRPTAAQRDVLAGVAEVLGALEALLPHRPSLEDLHVAAVHYLAALLGRLGLDPAAVHTYYPHNTAHHLGIDCHDAYTYPKDRPLEPGNVIAIEPGLYFPADDPSLPKEFRGMGVRIEDNYHISEQGAENLCSKLKR